MIERSDTKSDLTLHWVFLSMLLSMLIIYNLICHTLGAEIQTNLDEEQRVIIRTIFYVIAIILFPVISLLRYILLRLNQTMPGDSSAKKRYLVTVMVTLLLIETIAIFGPIMFVLGDEYNSLYIFSALAALGLFLHRPKREEYRQIVEALKLQN